MAVKPKYGSAQTFFPRRFSSSGSAGNMQVHRRGEILLSIEEVS